MVLLQDTHQPEVEHNSSHLGVVVGRQLKSLELEKKLMVVLCKKLVVLQLMIVLCN